MLPMLLGSMLLKLGGSALASRNEMGANLRSAQNVSGYSLGLIVYQPRLQKLLAFCAFETAFYVAYRYGMSFSQACASPFWFPDSVLLCALLLSRPGCWWIFILGALPIRLFSDVARDLPFWFLLVTFAIDSARGVLTAVALRHFLKNPIRFDTVQAFAFFCLWAVLLIPAVAALGGAAARHVLEHDFRSAWEQWFLGNALAHLVVTPALLYWVFRAPWKRQVPGATRWVEAGLLAIGLIVTGSLAFDTPSGRFGFAESRFYAPVPFLFWAAIRFGMAGACGAIAVIAFLSVEAALEGHGPFAGQSPADTAVALQHFLLLRAAPLYLVAILTEQSKGVEQSLRESQERITLAATAADLGLWEWDIVRDEIWFTNPSRLHLDLAVCAPMDCAGFIRLVHPDDGEDVTRALTQSMHGNGDYERTYRVVLPSGQVRWVASIGRVEFDTAHKPVWLRGVSRDITRSQQVEHQVQQHRDELAHLSRVAVLGELSGSLAHELNQPLAAILCNAQAAQRMLAQDGADLHELREILRDIVADDRRAGEIIQGLRQLFKRGEIQRQQIDVNALVRHVLKLAQSELVNKDVDLHTALAENLPLISGDGVQLQQLLLNLITNACNTMSDIEAPGRRLVIRTRFSPSEGVCVTVSDWGHGIPDDNLERIFEPFFTTRPEGMGLGLAVCRTIISVHRGRLWAENNADRGASFHCLLPASERDQA